LSIRRPDFAVDAMLGNLARKLRILGYNTKYSSSIEDKQMIELAKKEKRVMVTKDEALTKSAEKIGITTVLIRGNDEIDQIIQITTRLGLANFVMDTNSSRCVDCNGKLESIEKSKVVNKVPTGIYERQDQFWICVDCQKIYWEGTHFVKLQEFVANLNKRLK
jgi:uncharacterized protein with PIN domain